MKGFTFEEFKEGITDIAVKSGFTGKIKFEEDKNTGKFIARTNGEVVFIGNSSSFRISVKRYNYGTKVFESMFIPAEFATDMDREMGIAIA